MVMVICIMALFLALSMALLLASSVMVSNAAKARIRFEVHTLTQSLADELERDLTMTQSQRETLDQQEQETSIWWYVNEAILSGTWKSGTYAGAEAMGDGEVRSFQMDVQPELLTSCELALSWEQAAENQVKDALLTVKLTCCREDITDTVVRYYVADDGKPQENDAAEMRIRQLCWVRSEREVR